MLPEEPELVHILKQAQTFSWHSATRLELPFWWSLRLASFSTGLPELRVNRDFQTKGLGGRSPPSSFEVLEDVFFFCCPPPYLDFFGWGLVGGLGDFSFLNTFSGFASLGPLLFLISGINQRCTRWGRSVWMGYHRHSLRRAPSVGHEQGK